MGFGPTTVPGLPGLQSLGPISLGSSAKSGDVSAYNEFRTGNFGGGFDMGSLGDYWPLLLVGAGVWWYVKRKK